MEAKITEVFSGMPGKKIEIPLLLEKIKAGFTNPAEKGYVDKKLDLNDLLISNQAATFFMRVSGDSMEGVGTPLFQSHDSLYYWHSTCLFSQRVFNTIIKQFTKRGNHYEKIYKFIVYS